MMDGFMRRDSWRRLWYRGCDSHIETDIVFVQMSIQSTYHLNSQIQLSPSYPFRQKYLDVSTLSSLVLLFPSSPMQTE
jgi:hypothetical protein